MSLTDSEVWLMNTAETFNERYPVGTPVRFWPGVRMGEGTVSTTRSPAEILSGHTPVVWVENYAGCIALTHVQPLASPTTPEGATAMTTNEASTDSGWTPSRTPATADAPEEEFCGYMAYRHHMDSHDYSANRDDWNVPCTECPDGICVR